jgi:hypothetical protein
MSCSATWNDTAPDRVFLPASESLQTIRAVQRKGKQGDRGSAPRHRDTVKRRVKSILAKLDANDRAHAAIIGLKRRIIEL